MANNNKKKKIVVAVSGGFDPIHVGHVRMFEETKKMGDKLVVILNNGFDFFTTIKDLPFLMREAYFPIFSLNSFNPTIVFSIIIKVYLKINFVSILLSVYNFYFPWHFFYFLNYGYFIDRLKIHNSI